MGGLAEFVMRGRMQALLVICISAASILFFWVGAAALALVTLRRGLSEGLVLLMWALLPAIGLIYYSGEVSALVALLGSYCAAAALRVYSSWPAALLTAMFSGLLTGLALLFFAGEYVAGIEAVIAEMLAQLQEAQPDGQAALPILLPDAGFITGVFGLMNALTVAICLVLARFWQSRLYNPGGFREEFHHIRLTPVLSLGLVFAALACLLLGGSWLPWAYLISVPCLFAGISLVHALVGIRQLHRLWVGVFYVLLVLINPMKELVILAALVDSWADFRQRALERRQ